VVLQSNSSFRRSPLPIKSNQLEKYLRKRTDRIDSMSLNLERKSAFRGTRTLSDVASVDASRAFNSGDIARPYQYVVMKD